MEEHQDLAIDQMIEAQLERMTSFPGKYSYKVFDLKRDPIGILGYKSFQSQSLEKILGQSEKIVIFAATLGSGFDALIHRLSYGKSLEMMILNACGSAQVEMVADQMAKEISKKIGGYQTPRYSPGYGDFDLSFQADLISLLNSNTLGISVTDHYLLTPSKSISGVIGISSQLMTVRYDICDDCLRRTTCDHKTCRRKA